MVCYRIKIGKWKSKHRMPFIEAELLQKKLLTEFADIEIVAERE